MSTVINYANQIICEEYRSKTKSGKKWFLYPQFDFYLYCIKYYHKQLGEDKSIYMHIKDVLGSNFKCDEPLKKEKDDKKAPKSPIFEFAKVCGEHYTTMNTQHKTDDFFAGILEIGKTSPDWKENKATINKNSKTKRYSKFSHKELKTYFDHLNRLDFEINFIRTTYQQPPIPTTDMSQVPIPAPQEQTENHAPDFVYDPETDFDFNFNFMPTAEENTLAPFTNPEQNVPPTPTQFDVDLSPDYHPDDESPFEYPNF